MDPEISVIVPCCNEKGNVVPLHRELTGVLGQIGPEYEIIIVDDGSTDGTTEELAALARSDSRVKLITFGKNAGQSAAMMAGFRQARAPVLITLDADLQNDPSDIPALVAALRDGQYDVVCGWRTSRSDPAGKRAASHMANLLRRAISGETIHDAGCTLRAYRHECVPALDLSGELHRYIPSMLFLQGYSVGEVPVRHRPRVRGRTKYSAGRLVTGFVDLVRIRLRYGRRRKLQKAG